MHTLSSFQHRKINTGERNFYEKKILLYNKSKQFVYATLCMYHLVVKRIDNLYERFSVIPIFTES